MFCPECSSILRPKEKSGKKTLFCSCGYVKEREDDENTHELTEKVNSAKKIEIIEKVDTNPKIKTNCEKCQNKVAYFWTQQTRGADEPETRFFKCTKCSYTWREYD